MTFKKYFSTPALSRLLLMATALGPSCVFAAGDIVGKIKENILNPIIGVMAALAVMYFLWGIFEYVQAGADAKALETAQRHIIWGLFGLAIIFGVNGVVGILDSTVTTIGG